MLWSSWTSLVMMNYCTEFWNSAIERSTFSILLDLEVPKISDFIIFLISILPLIEF